MEIPQKPIPINLYGATRQEIYCNIKFCWLLDRDFNLVPFESIKLIFIIAPVVFHATGIEDFNWSIFNEWKVLESNWNFVWRRVVGIKGFTFLENKLFTVSKVWCEFKRLNQFNSVCQAHYFNERYWILNFHRYTDFTCLVRYFQFSTIQKLFVNVLYKLHQLQSDNWFLTVRSFSTFLIYAEYALYCGQYTPKWTTIYHGIKH